ncbi:hypothetical protein JTB14_025016 [Gonioctena quinquepunctata]|nr:hypothetical protein JTB14_025016 [Gonioctena quinquepunctata]
MMIHYIPRIQVSGMREFDANAFPPEAFMLASATDKSDPTNPIAGIVETSFSPPNSDIAGTSSIISASYEYFQPEYILPSPKAGTRNGKRCTVFFTVISINDGLESKINILLAKKQLRFVAIVL